MIAYLQVEKLTKSYGDRILFNDISFGVAQGDKIGLIARNGKGKSTLLRILAGQEDYDSGKITYRNGIRVSFLEQTPHFDSHKSLLENLAANADRQEKAKRFLTQLNLDYNKKVDEMSGGELKRAAIVRAIVAEPDIMILDEPTNHLDIDIIEWLENYLSTQKTTILMVTHDRYFLDKICSRILEIDMENIYSYEGNYDYYIEKRTERRENMAAEKEKVQNLLRKEREWMRRQPQARGSKAKYRIDNFYELEKKSRVNLAEKDMTRPENGASYIGSKIFEASGISKSYGSKCLIKDWSYIFARYEKVGIVGNNGVGKSTFIKMLLGEVTPDAGKFEIGQTVKWGYYSQDGMVDFKPDMRVIDAVRDITETVRIDDKTTVSASAFLSRFLFPPADQQKYVRTLSGGERRRLYLATVLMRNPNFLVLDEPTNDLDIPTLAVLEDYLASFKGCVIIVSHDRYFLDRTVDHLFVFKGDGIVKDFPGDYSTYRHCLAMERQAKREEAAGKADKKDSKNSYRKPREQKGLTYNEKREKEQLETLLPQLEKEKAELETAMSSGQMSVEEITAAGKRMSEIITAIDEKEFRLLELLEKE